MKTGEVTPEALFESLSLRELCFAANDLNSALAQTTEDNEFIKVCQEYIAEATADKVDAYSFVASYLEADVAAWQEKKNKLLELVDEIISRKQRELEMLKSSLLKMYALGLIDKKLKGKTRTITIQPNPPKVAQLHIQPDSAAFPEELREIRVEYKANNKAIVEAWKAGEDVSAIASVEQGHHVRFRYK